MSGTKDDADTAPSDVEPPAEEDTHTDQDAPTDQTHQDAGDGSLATTSDPAGMGWHSPVGAEPTADNDAEPVERDYETPISRRQ